MKVYNMSNKTSVKIEKPKCKNCQIVQAMSKGLCSKCYAREYRKTDSGRKSMQNYNNSKGKIATKKYLTKKYGAESVIYKKVIGMVENGVTIANACINIGIPRRVFTANISDAQRNELTQIRLANKKTISKRRDLFFLGY